MYYNYEEPIKKIASHRILALNRGESEKILQVKMEAPVERIIRFLEKMMIKKEDGSWALFYPEDSFFPGLYALPAPHSKIMEFKFLLNGIEIMQHR